MRIVFGFMCRVVVLCVLYYVALLCMIYSNFDTVLTVEEACLPVTPFCILYIILSLSFWAQS